MKFFPEVPFIDPPFLPDEICANCGNTYGSHFSYNECPKVKCATPNAPALDVYTTHGQKTLRDEFAKAALEGIATSEWMVRIVNEQHRLNKEPLCDTIAKTAYLIADAMMKVRKLPPL